MMFSVRYVVAFASFALLISALLVTLHLGAYSETTNDFIQYWSAFRLAIEGMNPYDSALLLERERMIRPNLPNAIMMWNPPWILLILFPVLVMPYQAALLFYLCSILLAVFLSYRLLVGTEAKRIPQPRDLGVYLLTLFTFYPVLSLIESMQSSGIVLIGTLLILVFRSSQGRAYIVPLAVLCCAVKPHVCWLLLLGIGVWLIKDFSKKEIALSAGVFALLLLSVEAVFPGIYGYWLEAVVGRPTNAPATFMWKPYSLNQFALGFLYEFGGFSHSRTVNLSVSLIGIVVAVAAALVILRRYRPSLPVAFGICLCLSQLFTPHLFPWDVAVLLPFYLMLVLGEYRGGKNWLILLAVNGIVLFAEALFEAAPLTTWLIPFAILVSLTILARGEHRAAIVD